MKNFRLLFFLLSLPAWGAGLHAPKGPFFLTTQHPIYLQTANLFPDRAETLEEGTMDLRLGMAYSNLYERESSGTRDLHLDTELFRLGVMGRYGFHPGWEGGLELPFYRFDGGFLDAFIQGFHDLFGLPNGGRDQVPNGNYTYRIRFNGTTYEVPEQDFAVGDLTLFLKNQITVETEKGPALAWRFAFKFPSGDPDKGAGSGQPGFGLGLAGQKTFGRFHLILNTNYLVERGNEILEAVTRSAYVDFTASAEYSVSRPVGLIVQLTGGIPRLKNMGFESWDRIPLDFIVGAAGEHLCGRRGSLFLWQLGFSEDITATGPSVDFTAWASVGIRFPLNRNAVYKGDMWARRFAF